MFFTGGKAIGTHLHLLSGLKWVGLYLYSAYKPSWRGQGKFYFPLI
jgi:hypothetical protein